MLTSICWSYLGAWSWNKPILLTQKSLKILRKKNIWPSLTLLFGGIFFVRSSGFFFSSDMNFSFQCSLPNHPHLPFKYLKILPENVVLKKEHITLFVISPVQILLCM